MYFCQGMVAVPARMTVFMYVCMYICTSAFLSRNGCGPKQEDCISVFLRIYISVFLSRNSSGSSQEHFVSVYLYFCRGTVTVPARRTVFLYTCISVFISKNSCGPSQEDCISVIFVQERSWSQPGELYFGRSVSVFLFLVQE